MTIHDECYVSIDPGAAGAFALFNRDGRLRAVTDIPTISVTVGTGKAKKFRTKLSESELVDMLTKEGRRPFFAYIEHQQAMGGKLGPNGKPQGGGAMNSFAMGESYGLIRGILAALRIPYQTIRPGEWKKALGFPAGSDKEASRQMALRLYPDAVAMLKLKKHEARAEAILIGRYGAQRYPADPQ